MFFTFFGCGEFHFIILKDNNTRKCKVKKNKNTLWNGKEIIQFEFLFMSLMGDTYISILQYTYKIVRKLSGSKYLEILCFYIIIIQN